MIDRIKTDVLKQLKTHSKRLMHVNYVALIAQTLAKAYKVSLEDAFIAGILHDYAKYEDDAFNKQYISSELLAKYANIKVHYHSIAAANYARTTYNINDNIYDAIYNHIFGRSKMSLLEKIIFVSDSIILTGKDNTKDLYKLAFKDLDKALLYAINLTEESLKLRGLKPHKKQIDTKIYYQERNI